MSSAKYISDTEDTETFKSEELNEINMVELMKKNYEYPDSDDPDLQPKVYKKREFYEHKIIKRPDLENYNDIKKYRDLYCASNVFIPFPQQAMLSNFINPNTPYTGLIIYHGLGVGKCVLGETLITLSNISKTKVEIKNIFKREELRFNYFDGEGFWFKPSVNKYVVSYDTETKLITKKTITAFYKQYIEEDIYEIELENGEIIKKTQNHKLLTNLGWKKMLNINDIVLTYSNNKIKESKVININTYHYEGFVYDLEIDETHNYIANDIITHNTCTAINIAENFKDQVKKYNTKIHILVPGPILKQQWKDNLLFCTGETYKNYQDNIVLMDPAEKAKEDKLALSSALQFYRIMSYRGFYKRVLGEKIIDRGEDKGRVSYKKTEEGEFERDVAVDRIYNLNNSLLIVDEAHNLTGNEYGEAIKTIIKNSTNLRVLLLTATPMGNLASDIIELLNYLRPEKSKIEKERVFTTGGRVHELAFKEGGLEYLKNMASGYVSHVRGSDPLTYAKRIDKGVKLGKLRTIKAIPCKMLPFQKKTYDDAIKVRDENQDTLDRRSEAVANFAFPGLDDSRKNIIGYSGRDGIETLLSQIRNNYDLLNRKISSDILGIKGESDLVYASDDGKNITGKIFKKEYLRMFSTKFYSTLRKLERLIWGKKGAKTAFVYSNLVKAGIELFEQVLLQNGYLLFQEDGNYQIKPNTVCYFCGKTHGEHKNMIFDFEQEGGKKDESEEYQEENSDTENEDEEISEKSFEIEEESSSDYDKYKNHMKTKSLPKHEFKPATFITVTGRSGDELGDAIPEEKVKILRTVFSDINNKEGKFIKFVLGSKVMNEGVSIKNVGEVHILDVHFNLGKMDQAIGRAIRNCSHHKLMTEENVFPFVNVYKYAVVDNNGTSTEIELYEKAEEKHILVKKVERALKEIAVDCALNTEGNMFKEEIEEFKNCENDNENPCPSFCDYTSCHYKCSNVKLNLEYYDPDNKIYKNLPKDKIDNTTFTHGLARSEIESVKKKIKEMYMNGYMYTIGQILSYVKNGYPEHKKEMFSEFYVFKAVDELIPLSENDFNNYKDTIVDKFNRQGYLIYRSKYYIFQPYEQTENVPMYYRTNFDKNVSHQLSVYNYLKNLDVYKKIKKDKVKDSEIEEVEKDVYDFESVLDYYDNRDEFDFVGIIDKESSKKTKANTEDVFKIREKRAKVTDKKREIGLPSLKGAVCYSSKSRDYLESIAKKLNIEIDKKATRNELCDIIKEKMIYMEKYGTKKNNITYIMIPANHPKYKFPLNLEDRVEYVKNKLLNETKLKLNINVKEDKIKIGKDKGLKQYIMTISGNGKLDYHIELLKELGFNKEKNDWILIID